MDRWKNVLALTVAGLLLAGPALAQSSAPSTTDTPKSDAAQPDTKKSDAEKKSDAMKSEGMKSDPMKSDSKAGKAAAVRGNQGQVKAAQQALKDKGHDPGSIDGVMGPKTQAALEDFQKAQGLTETGRLDAETMAKLGIEGKMSQAESASPSASPQTAPGAAKDKPSPTGKPQTR